MSAYEVPSASGKGCRGLIYIVQLHGGGLAALVRQAGRQSPFWTAADRFENSLGSVVRSYGKTKGLAASTKRKVRQPKVSIIAKEGNEIYDTESEESGEYSGYSDEDTPTPRDPGAGAKRIKKEPTIRRTRRKTVVKQSYQTAGPALSDEDIEETIEARITRPAQYPQQIRHYGNGSLDVQPKQPISATTSKPSSAASSETKPTFTNSDTVSSKATTVVGQPDQPGTPALSQQVPKAPIDLSQGELHESPHFDPARVRLNFVDATGDPQYTYVLNKILDSGFRGIKQLFKCAEFAEINIPNQPAALTANIEGNIRRVKMLRDEDDHFSQFLNAIQTSECWNVKDEGRLFACEVEIKNL